MHRIEVNAVTGEQITIHQLAYRLEDGTLAVQDADEAPPVDAIDVLSDEDLKEIGAHPSIEPEVDPVSKLKAFLVANPDVAEILK